MTRYAIIEVGQFLYCFVKLDNLQTHCGSDLFKLTKWAMWRKLIIIYI